MMYLKSSYTSYQGETNLLVFYVVLVDLELEHEGAAPGSTSQPVRRNISLKLKAKSNSASSLSSGKSKKKEGKSGEKSRAGSEGKEANFLSTLYNVCPILSLASCCFLRQEMLLHFVSSPRCINGYLRHGV